MSALVYSNSGRILASVVLLSGVMIAAILPSEILILYDYDKTAHFCAFAFLMGCASFFYQTQRHRYVAAAALIMFGVLIEAVQYYVPTREASMPDMLANMAGIICVVIILQVKPLNG